MSDIEIEVSWSRAVLLDDGAGTQQAGMTVRYTMDPSTPVDEIKERAVKEFQEVKALVLSELNLEFDQDETTGKIIEMFPGATPVANWHPLESVEDKNLSGPASDTQQRVAAHLGNHLVPVTGEPSMGDEEKKTPLPDPAEITNWVDQMWYMLLTSPQDWTDNRPTASSKVPDFTAKDSNRFPDKGQLGCGKPQALFIQNQYGPAPAWVLDNLHLLSGMNE